MSRVELSPGARRQVRTIDTWWRANRPSAPNLFAEELTRTLEQLGATPLLGTPYPYPGPFEVRRLLLPRSRYSVYVTFEPENDLVKVRAVWHTARGRGPALV